VEDLYISVASNRVELSISKFMSLIIITGIAVSDGDAYMWLVQMKSISGFFRVKK
jgi:hypothetical protein